MAKLAIRVRLKGTHITGTRWASVVEGTETLFFIWWDDSREVDTRTYKAEDLEPAEKEPHGEGPRYAPTPQTDRKYREYWQEQNALAGMSQGDPKRQIGHKRV